MLDGKLDAVQVTIAAVFQFPMAVDELAADLHARRRQVVQVQVHGLVALVQGTHIHKFTGARVVGPDAENENVLHHRGYYQRFIDTYFTTYPGMLFTGDECRRDEDGYYWITGRVDDVINVSGHRMGTAELESALVAHPAVAEAAVVGYPHDIKGQGLYMFVTLSADRQPSEEHRQALKNWLRKEIGPIAHPDVIQWAPGLPKTRSGRSCAASCARSPTTNASSSATSRPWRTPRWYRA